MSQSGEVTGNSSLLNVQTLTGNSGGPVGCDTNHNIDTLGAGSITIVGSPATHTLTTELTGITQYNVLVGVNSNTIGNIAPSASVGTPLISQGTAANPTFATLPVAGGGTGATTLTGVLTGNGTSAVTASVINPYALIAGGASSVVLSIGTGSTGQVLQSNGNAALPTYSTATYPSTTTANEILYSSATNTVGQIATSANGVLITNNSSVPSLLAAGTPGYILTANSAAPPSWEAVTASGAITQIDGDSGSMTPTAGVVTISGGTTGLTTTASSSTMDLTGTLSLANGGTSASLTASNGGIFYSTGSAGAILAGTATADQVLLSGSSTTPAWSTATYPATTTVNQLLYSSSANVIGGLATANNGVLTTGTSGTPVITALASDGQVIIGSGAGAPIAATLTAGTGISVTNGHNSITIASTGSPMVWTDKSTSFNATSGNGYFTTAAIAATLPASPSQGNVISFVADTASALTITANTGQVIRIGAAVSAAAGTAASNAQGDSVTLVYRSSDTSWIATSVIGTWTVT